jgi:hypothetical protein
MDNELVSVPFSLALTGTKQAATLGSCIGLTSIEVFHAI